MSSTADGREIYVIGVDAVGNREVVVVEDGEEHDMPSTAEYTYASGLTTFPYAS